MVASPRILVVRLSSLGDVVLATSVPAVLKSVFPEARITFLTKGAFAEILTSNPDIDHSISLRPDECTFAGVLRVAQRLRAERFDLIIDLQVNPRTILLCALVSLRKCVRAERDALARHTSVRFRRLPSRRCRHVVQRYLAAVQKQFGPVPALKPHIFLTETEKSAATTVLNHTEDSGTRGIVGICPGARWKTKVWGADKMSMLANELAGAGCGVVVLGGPMDEPILGEMKLLCGKSKNVRFHSGNLRSIAALMSCCDCVVSNDSGLMHMAYSVETPVVAIFGSTTPEFGFYPPDSESTVISKSFNCKPCDVHGKDKCDKGYLRCMESVKISEVAGAVEATLKRAGRDGRNAEGQRPGVLHAERLGMPRFMLGAGEAERGGNSWELPERGSVVVRVPNWVGDVVMSYPFLAALRRCTKGLRLLVVAHERVADLLRNVPFLDGLEVMNGKSGRGFIRTALALRSERFAVGVTMPDSFSSAFLFWLGGVKRIVGFRDEMREMFLSTQLTRGKWNHLSDQYAQLLPAGCRPDENFLLVPGRNDVDRATEILRRAGVPAGSRLALVAPGASYGETKRWPEEKYSTLVKLLTAESGFEVLLIGSVLDKEVCARIARRNDRRAADLSGLTTLRDLAAIASIASVFVGNDSGAAHVAAVSGCPVVAIFGSSDPSWTAPRGGNVAVIYEKLSCSPCFRKTCPYELQCLTQIDPERVYRTAVAMSNEAAVKRGGSI